MNDDNEISIQDTENLKDDVTLDSDSDIDDSVIAEESQGITIKKLREKLRVCESERQEYLTGWQKTKADFINLRKRDGEEKELFAKTANESLVFELLPILDSIELAKKNKDGWEALPLEWRQGMDSIFTQLKNILKKSGLEEIEALGKKFDPRFHEAISTIKIEEKDKDHEVAEVLKSGYAFHEKTLRPATVRIWEYQE